MQEEQEAIKGSITETIEKLRTLVQETAQEEKKALALTAEVVPKKFLHALAVSLPPMGTVRHTSLSAAHVVGVEQRMEVDAALQAQTAENKATSSEVLSVQAELAAVKEDTAAQKKAFITECRALDDTMRYVMVPHFASSQHPILSLISISGTVQAPKGDAPWQLFCFRDVATKLTMHRSSPTIHISCKG